MLSPTKVNAVSFGARSIYMASCGHSHTVALTTTGELLVWGSVAFGKLGLGKGMIEVMRHNHKVS